MKLKQADLTAITETTLGQYQQNAHGFWEGTKDHDVSQNYEALLSTLPAKHPLKILDFGCGPGRDLLYFKNLGHEVIGLDGSAEFCSMASQISGCEVRQQNFLKLQLPSQEFDGIFANASLFHIPSQELPRVLKELAQALKAQGILFSSNPRGDEEGWNGSRYGYYMEFPTYEAHLEAAGFRVLKHYYRPAGKPCSQQAWLAVVSQKA